MRVLLVCVCWSVMSEFLSPLSLIEGILLRFTISPSLFLELLIVGNWVLIITFHKAKIVKAISTFRATFSRFVVLAGSSAVHLHLHHALRPKYSTMSSTELSRLLDLKMPNACSHCKKQASQTCNGCQNTPGQTLVVYYCNTHCQKLDWANHKDFCNSLQAQRKLHRAGSILQAVCYIYREKILERFGIKVDEKGGRMYVRSEGNEPVASEWRLQPVFLNSSDLSPNRS